MLGDISGLEKIYIVCGYTDMRKSIGRTLRCYRRPAQDGSVVQCSLSFLWKKTGQDQSPVQRTGRLRSDL